MDAQVTVDRDAWADVRAAFALFFDGLGDVDIDEQAVQFRADDTGFDLGLDGSSSAFMPLHEARLRWTRATFDFEATTVTLSDGDSSYVYRVPQRLVDARSGRASDA